MIIDGVLPLSRTEWRHLPETEFEVRLCTGADGIEYRSRGLRSRAATESLGEAAKALEEAARALRKVGTTIGRGGESR